jgi:endonuclease YncB( thermonuclease family)
MIVARSWHGPHLLFALICGLAATLDFSRAQDGEKKSPIRDVTPPGMIRAYRSNDAPDLIPKAARRFENVRVDKDGTLQADGAALKLYGISLPPFKKICKTETGARWTCGYRAFMALRNFVESRTIACDIKNPSDVTTAVCWVESTDITRWLLQQGWAELADGITDKAYVEALSLARVKKIGLWSVQPPGSP